MATSPSKCHNELEVETEEPKAWKGHVLAVPWPGQGHINPMMHLSTLLAAQGVLVTFVNAQFHHERILQSRRASSPHIQTYPQGNIRLVGIEDGLGYDEYVANFSVPKHAQALIDLEPLLIKLVEEAQPPITCIIADLFVNSTPVVARRFGIAHVALWTQSAACYAAHVFFAQNHASLKEYLGKLRNDNNVDDKVISCVPSCPTMSCKELPTFLQPCDPSNFIFSYFINSFRMAPHNTFVLMNTFEELEAQSLAYIHASNILCIGPLLPPQYILNHTTSFSFKQKQSILSLGTSFWVEDDEVCLPWLHQQKPSSVLYISFGSITLMSSQQVTELAIGLEASGCPFLMVVRPEMMKEGLSNAFQDGFMDRMRDSGQAVFVEWAPQLQVLAHPAIGGFLTHAGWNSTLESICKGVPMLCWPYFGDQMLNVRCIVDTWKIGLDFSIEKVTNNEKWARSSNCGDNDDPDSTSEQGQNMEEVVIVKWEEIEKKVRQLMDPLSSKEIRKQISNLRLGAMRAHVSSCPSIFKSLVNVISC